MKPSNIFSKYQCDDKLRIYSEVPLNNRQYKKMIDNAKPRYMNDYFNTPRYNPKKDEKTFNNLLNSYYSDYNKLKKKYNFIEDEQDYEEEEEQNNNVDYGEYYEKRNNLYSLFLSNNMSDIDEINFDLTDNIVNNLNNGKNDTLLKNTQTQHDYDLRLNKLIPTYNDKEPEVDNISKHTNPPKIDKPEEDISSDNVYLDNTEVIDDNYLKLENNNNSSELFEDIIKFNNDKEYQPPLYVISNSDNEDINNELIYYINMIKKNNYPIFDQIINPNYEIKYVPISCFPRLPEDQIDNEDNQDNQDNQGNNKREEDEEILGENNKIDESYNFRDEKGEKKNNEVKNSNNDNNNKMLIFEQMISGHYDKNEGYIPPDVFPKSEGEEEDESKNKEVKYSEGNFEAVEDNNEIKNNMVENIINSNNKQKYSIPEYRMPDDIDKKEEKIEENNNQMKGNYINLENYKDKEYPTVGEMIKKDYNEDIKKEEENNKKQKENINNNNERFESIPVDDLNDDNDDDDYGGFD